MDTKKHNVFVMTAEHYFFRGICRRDERLSAAAYFFPPSPASCFLPLNYNLLLPKNSDCAG